MAGDRVDGITIVSVYPDLLGTYGDTANPLVLAFRARRRGVSARVLTISPGSPVPESADLYCLGGGEDGNQTTATDLLAADGGLVRAVGRGAVVLGVCAGLQLLGNSYSDSTGRVRAGLGVLDLDCRRLPERAVGEIVVDPAGMPGTPALTGYENHRGDAVLHGSTRPLGGVRVGVGNGGSGLDGAVLGRVVGTYLHGPLLARNPALADRLLTDVVGPLAPLGDDTATRLHAHRLAEALAAAHPRGARRARRRGRGDRAQPRP